MSRFRQLFCSAIISLITPSLFGAEYFVTQSGSGSHSGRDSANAWSLAEFNGSSTPGGGDTVKFSGTFSSTVVPGKSGTGNGAGRLTLDFSAATLNTANPRINMNAKNFITATGGVMGTASSGSLVAFTSTPSHDVTIENWTHTGSTTSTAVFVSGYFCYNLTVSNNTVDNIRGFVHGDSILNHDIVISNNYARTSLNTTSQTDIIFYGDAYNVMIEGNKFIQRTEGASVERHNDVIQTYRKGGGNAGNPRNWTLRYNWIEVDVATGSGDNSWMMMENMAGDPALKVYGNVFTGPGPVANNGLNANTNNSDAVFYFYNNTVSRKNSPDNTIRFRSPGTLYAKNNVGEAPSSESGTFLQWTMTQRDWGSNFFRNFDDCNTTIAGTGGSCSTDPKFLDFQSNNFALQSTSPLIGKGDSSIGAEYNQGIMPGATWPNPSLVTRPSNAWDVGAYQTSSGSSSRPNPPTSLTTLVE